MLRHLHSYGNLLSRGFLAQSYQPVARVDAVTDLGPFVAPLCFSRKEGRYGRGTPLADEGRGVPFVFRLPTQSTRPKRPEEVRSTSHSMPRKSNDVVKRVATRRESALNGVCGLKEPRYTRGSTAVSRRPRMVPKGHGPMDVLRRVLPSSPVTRRDGPLSTTQNGSRVGAKFWGQPFWNAGGARDFTASCRTDCVRQRMSCECTRILILCYIV